MTTHELLNQKYNVLVNIEQLAEIFSRSKNSMRDVLRDGRIPLVPRIGTGQNKRWHIDDIANYIDSLANPTPTSTTPPKKGRRVGSKNKKKESLFSFKDGKCDSLLNHCVHNSPSLTL